MNVTRQARQRNVGDWTEAAFGASQAFSVNNRGLRLFEEAAEAAQAAGCNPERLHALIDHVYAQDPGKLQQELGGIGICILAMAHAAGIDADLAETNELERILSKPIEHFRQRNQAKIDAGFLGEDCR